jgi:signal transduction histidine kinase
MVGHDLRGPLQAIKNAVYLLKVKPGEASEALKMIDDAVDRSVRMLNEVGQKTRESPSRIEPLDLSVIIRSAIEDASVPESIEVELKTEGSLSEVPVDALKMRRCLHNLITNAVEAMPKGGKITISAARRADGATIRVSDTGVGMAPEALSNLFKPFYTTKPKGWGLGLSYCKRAVEDHRGTITAESAVGRGTTFTIFIPIREAAASSQSDLMYRYDAKNHAYVQETPTG